MSSNTVSSISNTQNGVTNNLGNYSTLSTALSTVLNSTLSQISSDQNDETNLNNKSTSPSTGVSASLSQDYNGENNTDSQLLTTSVAISTAVLISMGICVFIMCRICNKRRHKNRKNQPGESGNGKARANHELSHQNASYDLTVSSESIQFMDISETNACKKEHSIAGNKKEIDSADDGTYQTIPDLSHPKCKDYNSIGQNDNELEDLDAPECTATSGCPIDPKESMYYTLENPKEKHTSNGNNTCSLKAFDDLQTHDLKDKSMGGRQDDSCKNPPTAQHSADSSENMYFTLEDPREKSASNADTTSNVNQSDCSESKQYENMGTDDQHVYAEVNKTPQSKGTPSPDSHTRTPESKHYENMDSKDLYAQVNKTSKSMGTPDPDSHSCVSASRRSGFRRSGCRRSGFRRSFCRGAIVAERLSPSAERLSQEQLSPEHMSYILFFISY